MAENYEKISLNLTKENKQLLKDAAERNGISQTTALNAIVRISAPTLCFKVDREIQVTQIPRGGISPGT
jgi:uncharacterized protein (DUF1778 family)